MTCVACGASAARSLYEVRGFPIVQCACGLARTALPAGFDPAAIYSEAYFQGGMHDGYADYASSAEDLRREFRGVVADLARHTGGGPGARLIEIGSAYGFFLDVAREQFTACGIEISDAARAAAIGRGHDVARDLTPEFLAARGPFDAAVMLDVVEHMQDPGAALAALHRAMRPGARLVLTTGDFGSAIARAMGKHWRLMTPPQHLWFFSPATVRALLGRHGFRVEAIAHPWKHVPLALMAYQAARYVGGQALVRRLPIRGAIPVNLFDAMRVTAIRG
jgi:SAM-dependent methyltransferase